ncbi:MAG: hypothetical protein ACE5JJ_07770 [Nitrospinota bacterium]
MFEAGWRKGAWVLVVLALPACGVSREVYEREREDLRAQVAALRNQLEGQSSQLASQGNALAELRLRAKDSAMAARESRRGAEEVRRQVASLERRVERIQGDVASLAAVRERAAKPSPPRGLVKGAAGRVIRQLKGRPLYFAGGFLRPQTGRYQYRLPAGTRVRILGERWRGFVRVRVLSGGTLKGRVMWVRAKWLEPES